LKGEGDKTRLASEKPGGGNSAASGWCANKDLHSAESVRVQNRELCGSNDAASLGAQLKCLYANAHSMGNKQEELEVSTHLWGYDIGITEKWWDSSCDWSIEWEDTSSLGRTGRGNEEEVSLSMSKISWSAWSFPWDWIRSPQRADGSRLKAGQELVTLQWQSVTGHLTRMSKRMRPSIAR